MILGLSAYYHDSAAALVREGEIVAAAQEERFTRVKHDHRFPEHAVAYCLREAGITPDDLTGVAFYDKPWLKFERLLETYVAFAPRGLRSFLKSMPLWIKEKLWTGEDIRRRLGEYEGPLYFPEHHQSHAASAFFPSPFDRAAILTLDGVGEWATSAWGVGAGHTFELKSELQFPHSIGLLYSAFTYYTGFRVNSGEYKVMGLAPYGEPRYVDLIFDRLVDLKPDGSFRMDMRYFNYGPGLTMTNGRFDELFGGPPRKPEGELTQRHMDLARSVQDVVEQIVLTMARHVRQETGETKLVMAGGVALNCVANGKLLREGTFDDFWIQPAAGDAGGALGAALHVWHHVLGNERHVGEGDSMQGSRLGPQFGSEEILDLLRSEEAPHHHLGYDAVTEQAAELLAAGKVVGWFQGRMEFGPRALGGRSILGDPRDPETQRTMNLKIKYRESFRPFAPSVLREDASAYFELEAESPYMLLVAPVREERRTSTTDAQDQLFGIDKLNVPRSDVPAITHVDYSARVQTVDAERSPRYQALIEAFKRRTGHGLVVNTSFNVRGEPVVCTPEDAYRCFLATEMDALVLEDVLLLKAEQPADRVGQRRAFAAD
ncbi:MAG: carbamoyltransferase [Bacteroidota bacterium]